MRITIRAVAQATILLGGLASLSPRPASAVALEGCTYSASEQTRDCLSSQIMETCTLTGTGGYCSEIEGRRHLTLNCYWEC